MAKNSIILSIVQPLGEISTKSKQQLCSFFDTLLDRLRVFFRYCIVYRLDRSKTRAFSNGGAYFGLIRKCRCLIGRQK